MTATEDRRDLYERVPERRDPDTGAAGHEGEEQTRAMERRLYLTFVAMAAVVLLCCLGITLAMDIRRESRELDSRISSTAAMIANLQDIVRMLETGYPDAGTIAELDRLAGQTDEISAILVGGQHGLRFYQTDRRTVGDTYVDGDEKAILEGSAPYITTVYSTRGLQHCAFHGIRNGAGAVIGFVMVAVPTAVLTRQRTNIFLIFAGLFIAMLLFAALLARAFLRFQTRALMGHRPGELLNLYMRQDEVVNSISEGLISADRSGKILFSNLTARRLMTGQDGMLVGRELKEVFPATDFDQVISQGVTATAQTQGVDGQTVLVTEVPIRRGDGHREGMLVILQDRTEALKLSDELSGARTMMDTLRAFNHEFLNKLHIILGYLQTGEIDRAKQFIINSSLVSSQSVRDTAEALRVSEVCALVIGKMMHAAELGIHLQLLPGSGMLERDLLFPADEYVTIIGNLLENAIEELSSGETELKEIRLGIYAGQGASVISCEDTGRGIDPDLLPEIFKKGVTTKGENHGTGLFLVKRIADSRGGVIDVETEPGEGCCITVSFGTRDARTESGSGSAEDRPERAEG